MENSIENPKIWYPHEAFYIESMLTITRTAMAEHSMLKTILEEVTNGKTTKRVLIIDLAQNIVSHAAAISRYFWPSNNEKMHKLRGQRLREAFEIHESNPIKNKDVRNFVEHFDEKLDDYLKENFAGAFYPDFIGSKNDCENQVSHFFRAFFIDEWKFHVLGKESNLVPIINELIRIHQLLEKYRDQGGRLPKSNEKNKNNS